VSDLRTGMAGFIALGVFVAVLVLIYFVYFVWALKPIRHGTPRRIWSRFRFRRPTCVVVS
jgi:hypothetical protein